MRNNKFIVLVAILSQLTGISAKADTSKISPNSVKTSESKKAEMNKQKKKKLENRSEVSSEEGYENLYPYGLWGFHEFLSLVGGESWWKYPSYLSVFKNLGRLFSDEKVEDLETQLKKFKEESEVFKKQREEEETKSIEEQFGLDADVKGIKAKIRKIQKKYKKHFEPKKEKIVKIQRLFKKYKYGYVNEDVRNFRIKNLAKLDDNHELDDLKFAIGRLANFINKQNVISGIISNMKVDIKNLKNQFNSRYKKEDPKDSYRIYDVVSVGKDVVKDALSKNSKYEFLALSFDKLKEYIDNNELQFFLIFSSASDCDDGELSASLVCCRNLSFAEKLIKSEAKNVKDPSKSSPFWKMFISPNGEVAFLECNIFEIKDDEEKNEDSDDESDKSSESNSN